MANLLAIRYRCSYTRAVIDPVRAWGDELVQLEHEIAMLEMRAAYLAFELADKTPEGFNGMVDWLRFNCHLTSTVAADRVNVGRHIEHMPESVEALCKGQIGYSHLKVMARTAESVGKVFDENRLLPLALEHSPGKFHFKCLHYRHSVDAAGHDRDQAEFYERRGLRLSTTEDGCLLISGGLDPVGGAAVRTVLESLAKPSGDHDERKREQRLADARVESVTADSAVQMQVTSSVETLLGLVGAPGAENEFSLPISAKTVERWACDCSVSRVLLQDSLVIDIGRAERTIKGARRRALMARDRHCRWPGCERPAAWCDAHHIQHWAHGGSGEIENQVLLCRRHHRMVHEGQWQLIRTDQGNLVTIAPTITFGHARGPDG